MRILALALPLGAFDTPGTQAATYSHDSADCDARNEAAFSWVEQTATGHQISMPILAAVFLKARSECRAGKATEGLMFYEDVIDMLRQQHATDGDIHDP